MLTNIKIQNIISTVSNTKVIFSIEKNDAFGLIVFNGQSQVRTSLKKVSSIDFQNLRKILKNIQTDGGTAIQKSFQKAKIQFQSYRKNQKVIGTQYAQNRIVMLTDIEDSSLLKSKSFIQRLQQIRIHTTIIGISSFFKTKICEELVYIKGFNYFCATEKDDLEKYLYRNFNFNFFPVAFDVQIKLRSSFLESIQVYGVHSSEKTFLRNEDVKGSNIFTITQNSTLFPSEIQLNSQNDALIYGHLTLIKLNFKQNYYPEFKATLILSYKQADMKKRQENYEICYLNEQQYYSSQSIYQALSSYFYINQLKSYLQYYQKQIKKGILTSQFNGIEKLKQICPKGKLQQLQDIIEILKYKMKVN